MPSNLRFFLLLPLLVRSLPAQTSPSNPPPPGIQEVLQRLAALENENRRLADELHALRQELAASAPSVASPPAPSLEERVDVAEKRIAEQAQTKVEAAQKFPISLTGMLLFNAFSSSKSASPLYSGYSPLLDGPARSGVTVGQSIVGFRFTGPSLPGQGQVNGHLSMDFLGAYSASANAGWFRIRDADISLEWQRRSLSFGQMKPLISPLEPFSLAEVATPPLAGAGNLWYWLPQVRYEERLRLTAESGVNLQAALMQTDESDATVAPVYAPSLQPARPALEGRAAYWRKSAGLPQLEIGGAFHLASTHVAGLAIPSHIASLDWSFSPSPKIQWSGTFYKGQNVAALGSLGNGFLLYRSYARAIHTTAGWSQLAVPLTNRLTYRLFGGIEEDNGSFAIMRDFTFASNLTYRLAPNVLLGVEALQSRYRSYGGARPIVNRYDLALGYLF